MSTSAHANCTPGDQICKRFGQSETTKAKRSPRAAKRNARRRYRPQAKFQTWLYRIAQHRIIDWYRKSRPEPLEEPDLVPGQSQTDESTRSLIAGALNEALLELPLEQRSAVLLHLERNMTLSQIAEVCGCGRETVKSRLRYATARLRKALGDLYAEL